MQAYISSALSEITLCLKKVPTFKLSVTLSNFNRLSKCLHCWKRYEICYKTRMKLPTSPYACCYTTLRNQEFHFLQILSDNTRYEKMQTKCILSAPNLIPLHV